MSLKTLSLALLLVLFSANAFGESGGELPTWVYGDITSYMETWETDMEVSYVKGFQERVDKSQMAVNKAKEKAKSFCESVGAATYAVDHFHVGSTRMGGGNQRFVPVSFNAVCFASP